MNCGRRIYVFLAVLQGEVDFAGGLAELPRSPRLAAWISQPFARIVTLTRFRFFACNLVTWGKIPACQNGTTKNNLAFAPGAAPGVA